MNFDFGIIIFFKDIMNNIMNNIDNVSNYYTENSDNINKYMFIVMNIFVLYFYPYLYFISYIVISYQKLHVDFSVTVSNNKISIDKLVFKNIDDDDNEEDDVQVNTIFNTIEVFEEQNNNDIVEEDDDDIASVINEEDITAIENEMSRVYDSIMNA